MNSKLTIGLLRWDGEPIEVHSLFNPTNGENVAVIRVPFETEKQWKVIIDLQIIQPKGTFCEWSLEADFDTKEQAEIEFINHIRTPETLES